MGCFDEDVLTELARLERITTATDQPAGDPSVKIRQWQELFGYSQEQAAELTQRRGAEMSRFMISDDLWDDIREEKETQGFDKDAYEHFLEMQPTGSLNKPPSISQGTASATYLLKLEGRLRDPQHIQALIKSADPLRIVADEENPGARFCCISSRQRSLLLAQVPFRLTLIRLSLPSRKDFDSNSRYPTIGVDPTLPQHRLAVNEKPLPSQQQYPVWYFFYGNLAIPSILSERLGTPEEDIKLRRASITGGRLSSWGGKYRALLDGDTTSATTIVGFGFLVRSPNVEDILRIYETDRYEVVRCQMVFADSKEEVAACTFRFMG